jgi:hypothetical protein
MSCLDLRHFEKIKQVSSTKLTNWYKTFVIENIFFQGLILIGANLKSQKILLPKCLGASSKKIKQVHNTKTYSFFFGKDFFSQHFDT